MFGLFSFLGMTLNVSTKESETFQDQTGIPSFSTTMHCEGDSNFYVSIPNVFDGLTFVEKAEGQELSKDVGASIEAMKKDFYQLFKA